MRTKNQHNCGLRIAAALLCLLSGAACRQDMADKQPKYKALQQSTFFGDDRSARPLVEGTVARGYLKDDTLFYTGKEGNVDTDKFPFPVTKEVILRGQQRFNIACAHCHDRLGTGNGIIVQRGFRQPPSYHIDRLRQAPVGHFFDVITNGFGAMQSHSTEVAVRDRWCIAAYIRVLQASSEGAAAAAAAPPKQPTEKADAQPSTLQQPNKQETGEQK